MASDNFDIYGDLDEALIEPLQEEVEKKAVENLVKLEKEKQFKEETFEKIEKLENSNEQLKKNLSILLATAKAEIERKDAQIKELRLANSELQREKDEIIFRKTKISKNTSDKYTQTSSTKNEIRRIEDKYNSKRRSEERNTDSRKRRESPERKNSRYDRKRTHIDRSRSKSNHREYESKTTSTKRSKEESSKKRARESNYKEDQRDSVLKKKRLEKEDHKYNTDKRPKELVTVIKSESKNSSTIKENQEKSKRDNNENRPPKSKPEKSIKIDDSSKLVDKTVELTFEEQSSLENDDGKKLEKIVSLSIEEITIETCNAQIKEELEPIPITNADSPHLNDLCRNGFDSNIKQSQETKDIEKVEAISTLNNCQDLSKNTIDDITPKSANESFDSTKELNNSMENEKHKKKRKIITTEVEDDGTVVFTVVRKKKKQNSKK
ncbi:hypothetical protein PVAND_003414 [Polypedilum vanderplanki]|uniref:Uncharacterized protein n=2 Tax=Polypedilum vanderplanki TaxID=319348 RepID=A0A9J6BTZ3_POLVA|nr:hypothetical protein PVAND_003414 [Polypedilum vanderplanki]